MFGLSCAGLPVSTTQVLSGALLGIGLFEGAKGVNWKLSAKVCPGCCNLLLH